MHTRTHAPQRQRGPGVQRVVRDIGVVDPVVDGVLVLLPLVQIESWDAPAPARRPLVTEVIDHEKGVRLNDLDVVQVVADDPGQGRLPDLLQLVGGEGPGIGVTVILVPEAVTFSQVQELLA